MSSLKRTHSHVKFVRLLANFWWIHNCIQANLAQYWATQISWAQFSKFGLDFWIKVDHLHETASCTAFAHEAFASRVKRRYLHAWIGKSELRSYFFERMKLDAINVNVILIYLFENQSHKHSELNLKFTHIVYFVGKNEKPFFVCPLDYILNVLFGQNLSGRIARINYANSARCASAKRILIDPLN